MRRSRGSLRRSSISARRARRRSRERDVASRIRRACAQRLRNWQPRSSPISARHQAGDRAERLPRPTLPGTGMQSSSPRVYGCAGSRNAAAGACLDDLAGIHHGDPVRDARDDAEVVRDQDQRHAELALQLRQQVQDLRLDRDVERGGRLVGDDQLRARTSAPSRSSPAGAGRPRAGADTGRAGSPRRVMPTFSSRQHRALARLARASRRGGAAAPPRAGCRSVYAGLSEVIGSWKIIAMPVAAQIGQRRSPAPQQVLAVEGELPPCAPRRAGSRPISASAVSDLPQPDSPTMHSVSPRSSARSTPRTACSRPAGVGISTRKSCTCRRGAVTAICALWLAAFPIARRDGA